ncbi:hypothetical protein [Capnocytophaga catalasegens]|uniref:hypothetical protein n=1 Tax=Capnocytophaga catalasegens TaxID=1004260 RepID=UPI00222F5D3E|nr:hypothetical protein [Capnocytophaga catalasegens]
MKDLLTLLLAFVIGYIAIFLIVPILGLLYLYWKTFLLVLAIIVIGAICFANIDYKN